MKPAIEIFIEDQDFGNSLAFAIILHKPHGDFIIKFATAEMKEIKYGEICGPSFVLPGGIGRDFMKAFVERAANMGFQTSDAARIDGTLKATERHLEDLRTILKISGKAKQ